MVYQIEVKENGESIDCFDGIEATSALQAIDRIETRYPIRYEWLDKNGEPVQWTGMVFKAIPYLMALS